MKPLKDPMEMVDFNWGGTPTLLVTLSLQHLLWVVKSTRDTSLLLMVGTRRVLFLQNILLRSLNFILQPPEISSQGVIF